MDSRVGNHIYAGLLELAHRNQKTILFSTNNLKHVGKADFVISLNGSGGADFQSSQELKLKKTGECAVKDEGRPHDVPAEISMKISYIANKQLQTRTLGAFFP